MLGLRLRSRRRRDSPCSLLRALENRRRLILKVFVVQHVHDLDNAEDVKFIGVYSTRERANQAVEALRAQPGFRESSVGFHIDQYELDEVHWKEGYVRK